MRGEEPYEMDWSKYFDNADMTEVRAHIASVEAMLEGMLPVIEGVPAEKLAPVVAESFVFGLVGYINNYPKVIDRIHEINPDAQLVIVGYFNPVSEMAIPIGVGEDVVTIPAGTMLGVLMESCNAYSLAYTYANKDNTIFVSVNDTTTILDEQGIFDYASQLNGTFREPWLTHAGVEGHQYIADQIYTAITTEYTNEEIAAEALKAFGEYFNSLADEFGDDIVAKIELLADLFLEYYDDAYAYGYDKAVEAGLIAQLNAYLDAAQGAINDAEIWLNTYRDFAQSEEFIAEVETAIEDLRGTIEAVRALINNADELDAESYEYLLTVVDTLTTDAEDLASLLAVAAMDADAYLKTKIEELNTQAEKQIAILKAEAEAKITELRVQLETAAGEAKAKLEAEIARIEAELEAEIAQIKAELEAAIAKLETEYNAAIEALDTLADTLVESVENAVECTIKTVNTVVENVKNYLKTNVPEEYNQLVEMILAQIPAADQYLYDWFYNNPDVVIGFFDKHGDDMIEFVVENAKIIVPVLGFIVLNYGDEVVNYVVENADVLLPAFVSWFETYGERTWEMLKVYLNALGVNTDIFTPEGIVDALNDLFALIGDLGDEFAVDAWDKLVESGILEDILDTIDGIKAEANAKLEYLQNVLKAEFEAQLDALNEELASLKTQLEAAIEEGNQALIDQLNVEIAKLEVVIAKVEAELAKIDAMIREMNDAVEELIASVDNLAEIVNAIIEAIEGTADLETLLPMLQEAMKDLADALVDAMESAALLEKLEVAFKLLVDDGVEALVEYLMALGNETATNVANALKAAASDAFEQLGDAIEAQLVVLADKINEALASFIEDALKGE